MPKRDPLSLDNEGYFSQSGKRIFLAGVNYWPATSGLRMWSKWDPKEISKDLDQVRNLGLNTIRFFILWPDFEPREAGYDERQFDRFEWILEQCSERGIWAHPSMFCGWMSGGIFWPKWKQDRNLYSDKVMRERCAALVRRAATAIARHRCTVAAIDLGNEMCCLPDADQASFSDIAAWCERMCTEIKSILPDMPVVSGCDMGQVIKDTPWAFNNQPGTDFYSIHAYPVTNWNPVPMAGLDDRLTRRLFAYYCAYARAYGPTMLQEFGTILTLGGQVQQDFLKASLPATAAEGVNGMLWWCLHDINSLEHPYTYSEMERSLGLINRDGYLKPSLKAAVQQLAEWVAAPKTLPKRAQPDILLYIPEENHTMSQDFLRHPNSQRLLGRRYLMAWHLICEAGQRPGFIRDRTLQTPSKQPMLFCGANFSPTEMKRLRKWVHAGGHLIIHGVSARNWGEDLSSFLGAKVTNYALNTSYTVSWAGTVWNFPPSPDDVRIIVEPQSAKVIAVDSDGYPSILRQQHGAGHITFSVPSPEDAACHDRARLLQAGDRWHLWLQAMIGSLVAAQPAATVS